MSKDNFYHDTSMFKGAPKSSFEKAKWLRDNMTEAEELLWARLKNNSLKGLKFRRQHPIQLFIVDFYCHKIGLVIEVDGEYHNSQEQIKLDKNRTKLLEFQGLHVVRFTNKEIYNDLETVIESIGIKVDSLS